MRSVADDRVETLPTGHARLVEVGRALASQPRVLLLDEPSSGLDEEETDSFAELLRSLAADGLGDLLVEHDVELVMKVCERIQVLDFGRTIAVGSPAEVQQDEAVQVAYLGTVGAPDPSGGQDNVISVDFRTRSDDGVQPVDAAAFFGTSCRR